MGKVNEMNEQTVNCLSKRNSILQTANDEIVFGPQSEHCHAYFTCSHSRRFLMV